LAEEKLFYREKKQSYKKYLSHLGGEKSSLALNCLEGPVGVLGSLIPKEKENPKNEGKKERRKSRTEEGSTFTLSHKFLSTTSSERNKGIRRRE